MKKLLIALALLLGVLFLISRFAELQDILKVFQRGNLFFLVIAFLVELAWIYNLSAFYQAIYRVFDMEEKRWHLLKLVTAAYFLTVVAPSAGLSAIAVYVADAKRKGRSIPRVTVASVLYIWFEYIATLAILIIGLGELAHRNNLHWSEITASLILLAGAFGIGLLLYLGMQSAAALGKVLDRMARIVNAVFRPIIHHDYLSVERAYSFSAELAEGIAVLRGHPRWVVRPLIFAVLNKVLLFFVLFFCFLAFRIPVDAGTLVAGLSIAHLFLIVSPTPAGIGIVEGILTVALTSLGITIEDAAVVTLAYRGFSFWLPLLIGMITFRLVSRGAFATADLIQSEPDSPKL